METLSGSHLLKGGNREQKSSCQKAGAFYFMAGLTGLEPATSGVTGRRCNQLYYSPADRNRKYQVPWWELKMDSFYFLLLLYGY